jgi:hypothetical protein
MEGRCGELPPQVGTTPQLLPEDFDDLCPLFWSMAALARSKKNFSKTTSLTIPQAREVTSG